MGNALIRTWHGLTCMGIPGTRSGGWSVGRWNRHCFVSGFCQLQGREGSSGPKRGENRAAI